MDVAKRPSTRRKSCLECVKAKRRCDQGLPRCARCKKAKLSCSYGTSRHTQGETNRLEPCNSDVSTSLTEPIEAPSTQVDQEYFNFVDPLLLNDGGLSTCQTLPDLDESLIEGGDIFTPPSATDAFQAAMTPSAARFSVQDVALAFKTRFGYGVNAMKMAPKMMVTQNQTPWSHPLLYEVEMPKSMQGTYSVSL